MSKHAMVYLQSGGPTSVINSSLYGAIKEAQKHEEISQILGSLNGIEGLLNDNLIDLGKEDPEQIELLKQTPGAILGSSRYKLPGDIADPIYEKIIATVRKHDIGYIFVNGGNDSMDTCNKLSTLFANNALDVKVMGVPKTVDNDLVSTDHSLGFGSAAKYVVNAVQSIVVDARCYTKGKVTIVEIMGRNAGWMTAAVDLLPEHARPNLIYIPEVKFDLDDFLNKVVELHKKNGHAIIALSEGVEFPRNYVAANVDNFGHVFLGGASYALADIVTERTGLSTRAIELNLPQRAFPSMVSKVDQDEAILCGAKAVEFAIKGETGKMVCIKRKSNHPYEIEIIASSVNEIANAISMIPTEMIGNETRMNESFRDYCLPLIQGEVEIKYENGIALVANLSKIKA